MALTKVTGHVVLSTTNIEFHNTKSTGIVTFTNASNATSSTTGALQVTGGVGIVKDLHVGGNVTVGGTLTYDDVTNIDSIGIITARGGINVSGGNVTIANNLDVDGSTTLDGLAVSEQATFSDNVFINVRGKSFKTSDWNITNTTSGNALSISGGNSLSEKLHIKSDGSVGLGTSVPTTKLHLDGGSITIRNGTAAGVILDEETGVGGSLKVTTAGGTASFGPGNSSFCHVQTDRGSFYFNRRIVVDEGIVGSYNEDLRFDSPINTPRMYVKSATGYVGIGTDNPTDLLDVFKKSSTAYDATADGAQRGDSASIIIRNDNGTTNSFSQLVFDTAGTNQSIARIVAIRSGTSSNDLAFVTEHSNTKSEKLRIKSNGRVGIGTVNPKRTLHVIDNVGEGIAVNGSQAGIQFGTVAMAGASYNSILSRVGTDDDYVTGTEAGDLCLAPEKEGAFVLGLSPHLGAMNVGLRIGRLRDYQIYFSGEIKINTGSPATPSEKLRIKSNGYVGIGTDNPQAGLVINSYGTQPVPNGNTYPYPAGNWSNVWNYTTANSTDYWVGFAGGYNVSSATVNISLAPNTFNFSTQQGIYIAGEATSTSSADFTVGKIIGGSEGGASASAGTKRATKSELFRIKSDGNVGIGTDNPDEKLHIRSGTTGNSKIVLEADHNSAVNGLFWVDEGNNTQSEFYYDHGENKQHLKVNGNGFEIYSKQTNSVIAKIGQGTGYNEFIVPNGNVGIGTDDPGARLDVFGNLQVQNAAGLQNFFISDSGFKFSQSVSNWTNMDYTSSPVLAWDYKNGPGDMFYIGSGGNTAMASQMALVVSDGHGVKIGKSGYDGSDFDISSTDEFLRIKTDGRVGVGTGTPQTQFDLYDVSSFASGYAPVLNIRNGYSGTADTSNALGCELRFSHRNHNSAHDFMATRIISHTTDNYMQRTFLRFFVANANNGTERLTINPYGNVGINSTNPSSTLDVFKFSDTSASSTATTLLRLTNHVGSADGTGDILSPNGQRSFIDFRFMDANQNFTPQVRIGAQVGKTIGDTGVESEGFGSFVVYTGKGSGSTGSGSVDERMKISPEGAVVIRHDGATGSDGHAGLEVRAAKDKFQMVLSSSSATASDNQVKLGFKLHPSGQDERIKGAIVVQGNGGGYGETDFMSFCLDTAADNGNTGQIYNDERVRISTTGFMGPIPRTGAWQGTYVYRQQNQGQNYEHKIRGPLSGYIEDEMATNSVAYIKVQTLGTGTNEAYCYYRWSQDGESAGATLTHIHGNTGNSSNRPYMVLDGEYPCWKTAHSVSYNYVIRVEITGGDDGETYTSTGDYAAN